MKTTFIHKKSPVAVGGVGGSGTRVVAQVLSDLGFFMGHDLNTPCDNLHFTLLFKRPEVLTLPDEAFSHAVVVFERLMGHGTVNVEDVALMESLAQAPRWDVHSVGWLQARVASVPRGPECPPTHWGWKEPNTHVVLGRLWQHMPDLRYVHVRRHGLDMAFSSNQNQPRFWGEVFTGEAAPVPITPEYSLRYWCAAEQRINRLVAQADKQHQFHVLNFDRLCLEPEAELQVLVDFLGAVPNNTTVEELAQRVQAPTSLHRYRLHDLNRFPLGQREFVQSLGFGIRI